MNPGLDRLRNDRVLLIDGGTGSELRRRGFPMRADVWSALASVSHYALLREIHADYIRAGADVITTNTFSTNRFVLEGGGLGDEFELVNRRAVQAAFEARDAECGKAPGRDVAIAASLSCLPPRFDVAAYPAAAAESRAYLELAELFAEAGVDLIAFEMMQEPVHARLACDAARAVGLPFWLGVSCRTIGSNVVSYDFPDVALGDCLEPLLVYEPRAVNVMHTPPAAVLPALAEIKLRWSGPVGAYPESSNAERAAAPSPSRDVVSPPQLAALATQWLAAGARLLGGCCGTTPDHIRALRQLIGDPRNR